VDGGVNAGKTTIADSVAGFSATQGKCGWSYGYLPSGAEPFTVLTIWDTTSFVRPTLPNGSVWRESSSTPPWLVTYDTAQSPNESPLQWNDRRWTSTVSGTIAISGHMAKADTGGGDGVTGRITVDGSQAWSASIAYNDSTGVDFNLLASVSVGSRVDFTIDPQSSDLYDTTYMTVIIAR
jgi:hypothetical protein